MNVVDNGTFTYATQKNTMNKWIGKSRLEVIQGHTFCH